MAFKYLGVEGEEEPLEHELRSKGGLGGEHTLKQSRL